MVRINMRRERGKRERKKLYLESAAEFLFVHVQIETLARERIIRQKERLR